jgi:hypothetical protein
LFVFEKINSERKKKIMAKKLLSCLFALMLVLLPSSSADASTRSFVVEGITHTFSVGTGADGDVIFRLTPGNPSQAEMLVNGVVRATTTATQTVLGNMFQSHHSTMTVRIFDIEDVVTHLPVNRTYAPGTFFAQPGAAAPALTNVPNFRNLTVGEGVMLRSRTRALAFMVQDSLVVEGILSTAHGAGGAGGTSSAPHGQPGGDASGDIVVYANSISVAPNGTNASRGAFLAGWGGGGGGGGLQQGWTWTFGSPGVGGRGGSVILYAMSLTVNGEIRAGNGGGGGGAPTQSIPGAAGGQGGFTAIYANDIHSTHTAVIASGWGGGGGGSGGHIMCCCSVFFGAGGGGYGGGGGGGGRQSHNSNAGSGGSAGNPGTPFPRPSTPSWFIGEIGFAGSSGRDGHEGVGGAHPWQAGETLIWAWNAGGRGGGSGGNGANGMSGLPGGPGGANGSITIRTANSLLGTPHIIVGYLSGGTGATRGQEARDIRVGKNIIANLFSHVTANSTVLNAGADITVHGMSFISSLSAGRDLVINNNNATITTGNITRNLDFWGGELSNSSLTIGGFAHLRGNLMGTINLTVTGDTRFLDNPNFRLDSWWIGRTVNVNGLRVRSVVPAASPNSAGLIEVTLGDWVTRYNTPAGTNPSMDFRVDRRLEGESEWTPSTIFTRSLTGTPAWADTRTVIGRNATYSAGFRLPGSARGFIFIDTNATPHVVSEGGGLDELPPIVNFFAVANDRRSVSEATVPVRISAQDNRTAQSALRVQITVNSAPFHFTGGTFVAGNNWGVYTENMNGLPLVAGENEIVLRIRDESMNIGSAIRFVHYLVPGVPGALSPPGTPETWALPASGFLTVSTPTSNAVFAQFHGQPAYFVDSERVILRFANLPAAIRFSQVSLDKVSWSEHIPIANPLRFNVRPDSFAPVYIRFAGESLVPGEAHELYVILKRAGPQLTIEIPNRATAVRTPTTQVRLIITDTINIGHQFSVNGGAWQNVPAGNLITVNLNPGFNTPAIRVRDIAGNIVEGSVPIWRL